MNPSRIPFRIIFSLLLGGFLSATMVGATTVIEGELIDDEGYLFDSFGNHADETTRGANFGGSVSTTWYDVTLTTDSTGATNGISWSGTVSIPGVQDALYDYTGYTLAGGTNPDANHITNPGISGAPSISITTTPGTSYTVDLLFANSFNDRTFDVSVDGSLYLDDFAIRSDFTSFDRPQVYRFDFLATASTMAITLSPGAEPGFTDTNPYVHAVMITAVPEPSAVMLVSLSGLAGLAALLMTRRRRG